MANGREEWIAQGGGSIEEEATVGMEVEGRELTMFVASGAVPK